MLYLKSFVFLFAGLAAAVVSAQDVAPPPFKPTAGLEIPSASIHPQTQKTAAVPAAAAMATAPAVGRVFALQGEWTNAAGQPIGIGSGVTAGEKLTPKAGEKSSILVALTSGSVFQRACPDAPDCANIVIPAPKSSISDNFERMLNGMERAPRSLKMTALGGTEAPVPNVLMTDGKLLHFGPVVLELPNAYYDLQFVRLKDGLLDADPTAKTQFAWSPKDSPSEQVNNLGNGIYRFTILRKNRPAAPSADVLVLSHREYTRLRPYFEEARQISNSWTIPDDAIRSFQVLCLYGLDASRRE